MGCLLAVASSLSSHLWCFLVGLGSIFLPDTMISWYCFKLRIQMNLLNLFIHSPNICWVPAVCWELLHIPVWMLTQCLWTGHWPSSWLPALAGFERGSTPVGCQSQELSLCFLGFILGKRGECHISGSIKACSLEQLKEVRERLSQLGVKRLQKRRMRLCWVLQRRTVKNRKVSAELRPCP